MSRTSDVYLAIIGDYAAAHPDEAWIRGGGWYMADFPGGTPRRERPGSGRARPARVFLTNRDGHSAWVNTKALEIAGMTAATADPIDGRIEREPDGTPTGTLHEGAMDLVERWLPDDTPADLEAALRLGQAHLHALGITAWQDAIVEPGHEERAYVALASRGELTARVVGALWWERHRGAEQIEEFVERGGRRPSAAIAPTSVKLMMDGVLENFTGAMLEPYGDGTAARPTTAGMLQIDPEGLADWVPGSTRSGSSPTSTRSATAPCASRWTRSRPPGGPTARPTRARTSPTSRSSTPTTSPASATLDVAANAQPLWAVHEDQMDVLTIPFLGERWRWQYPFRSLRAAGRDAGHGLRLERVHARTRCSRWSIAVERRYRPGSPGATSLPAGRAARARSTPWRRSPPARRT